MGLFDFFKMDVDFENIISVVIIEKTQLYKEKSRWGVGFGTDLDDCHLIAMEGDLIPDGMEIKFSITYSDEEKRIVTAMAGTPLCDKLLQLAIDPPLNINSNTEDIMKQSKENETYIPVQLKKNQLPNGKYLIGRDIPVGVYDFCWIWGEGSIKKFVNDHDTTYEAVTYYENIGIKHDSQYRQCFHVHCEEGELLQISGNVIVEISKSKPIELDLT